MSTDHADVVREWLVPIVGDKTAGITARRIGDSYFMHYIGTRHELVRMALSILKVAEKSEPGGG